MGPDAAEVVEVEKVCSAIGVKAAGAGTVMIARNDVLPWSSKRSV